MIEGEIELKDKIFITKKGTRVGKPYVNYRVVGCLFIMNSSKKVEKEYKKWKEKHKDELRIYTGDETDCLFTINGAIGSTWRFEEKQSSFEGVCWTDFKRRWELIDEAQKAGKVLSTLDSELIEEDEISISNKVAFKSW